MGKTDEQDRREVKRIFDAALGMELTDYRTERAYGYPADEAGVIELLFEGPEGKVMVRLGPTGYDPDGIGVDELKKW